MGVNREFNFMGKKLEKKESFEVNDVRERELLTWPSRVELYKHPRYFDKVLFYTLQVVVLLLARAQ